MSKWDEKRETIFYDENGKEWWGRRLDIEIDEINKKIIFNGLEGPYKTKLEVFNNCKEINEFIFHLQNIKRKLFVNEL